MKKLLIILLALFVAIIIGANLWIDNNSSKIYDTAQESLADHNVFLSDNAEFNVSLFPSPTLVVKNTIVTAEDIVADVNELYISISWWSLVSNQISIDHILIKNAHILISQPTNKAEAVALSNEPQPGNEPTIQPDTESTASPLDDTTHSQSGDAARIRIDQLRFENLSVTVDQSESSQTFAIAALNIDGLNLDREPFVMSLEASIDKDGQSADITVDNTIRLGHHFIAVDAMNMHWQQSFAPIATRGTITGSFVHDGPQLTSDIDIRFDNSKIALHGNVDVTLSSGSGDWSFETESLDKLLALEQPSFDELCIKLNTVKAPLV